MIKPNPGILVSILFSMHVTAALAQSAVPDFAQRLAAAALERTEHSVRYDGAYVSIPYPGGDVADNTGVCTDVVIRSYRKLGLDLQALVHIDMQDNFAQYPNTWGLKRPDSNIDHRRVPNLQTFFRRHGRQLDISSDASDYLVGDLVTWMLPGNLPHIGIVVESSDARNELPMIVHNIGRGPQAQRMLFEYPITGHYKYR